MGMGRVNPKLAGSAEITPKYEPKLCVMFGPIGPQIRPIGPTGPNPSPFKTTPILNLILRGGLPYKTSVQDISRGQCENTGDFANGSVFKITGGSEPPMFNFIPLGSCPWVHWRKPPGGGGSRSVQGNFFSIISPPKFCPPVCTAAVCLVFLHLLLVCRCFFTSGPFCLAYLAYCATKRRPKKNSIFWLPNTPKFFRRFA